MINIMKLYNLIGYCIIVLYGILNAQGLKINEVMPSNTYTIQWNETNNSGQKVGSSIYYVLMKSKAYQAAVKMVYIK